MHTPMWERSLLALRAVRVLLTLTLGVYVYMYIKLPHSTVTGHGPLTCE